jgi:hypothetical protein
MCAIAGKASQALRIQVIPYADDGLRSPDVRQVKVKNEKFLGI